MELYPPAASREPAEPDPRAARPRSPHLARRRFGWALAGALVAHGLLALALFHLPRPPVPERGRPGPIEVELRRAASPAATVASSPEPAASATPAARAALSGGPSRASSLPASRAPAAAATATAPGSSSSATPADGDSPPRERDAAWAAAEGLGPARVPGKHFGISRTLQDPLAALGPSPDASRPGAGAFDNGFGRGPQGPVHQPSREEALAEEKSRVEGRVTRWITDDLAVARANQDGGRDGRWQDLQDVLEKGFTPEWSLLDEHPGSAASPAPKAIRVFTEQYLKMADAYGKTGSPFGHEPGTPGLPGPSMNADLAGALAADRGLRGTPLDTQAAQVMQLQNLGGGSASPWLHRLVVHLLFTQRADGILEDVSIAGSSGNPIYDALALGHARDLSAHGLLTAPPPEHRKTIWAFEADFEQLPPAPVAGCSIGPNLLPTDCFYPFKKSIKSRVRLEAVY